jgi:hypothetical protein
MECEAGICMVLRQGLGECCGSLAVWNDEFLEEDARCVRVLMWSEAIFEFLVRRWK